MRDGGGGAVALDDGPNASAGRHKGGICLPLSHVCAFLSLDKG